VRRPGSLRGRLISGTLLWTAGIVAVVQFLSMVLIHRFPLTLGVVHITLMSVLAVGLIVAGLWQARRGLAPINRLRERLSALREGRERRVCGAYPSEVQPLVDDLNALLDDRERRVERALMKAGDFAHGLKTPLAVLAQEAERAEAAGHAEMAGILSEQVARMRRQVDSHLAHARAAASGVGSDARCPVAASVDGLIRTMLRLHAGRGIAIESGLPADRWVRVRREDLDEMLGNLLDNACQWARARVVVGAAANGRSVDITVDDDGPGLTPDLREAVLKRGVRADEAAPGSGLGLAIVADLAELYGGSIALEGSPAGGLRARLTLPSAPGA
jgi:signal transduction histidine kinase